MDSAQWRAYGRTIETVIISFDGCGVDMGEGLQCLLIKVFGLPSLLINKHR